jgi:acyl-coenzyme A thioesterase PaaI-like protein
MLQNQPVSDAASESRVAAQASLVKLQQREHPMCIVCSPHNPSGLKLRFTVQADGSVVAVFDSLPILQSYPGVLHGGVIATILDSAMLYALFAIDVVAVTATFEVRYLAPTVTGRFAMVRGWTSSTKTHPLYAQRAQLIQDGKVMVEASAKFAVPGVL